MRAGAARKPLEWSVWQRDEGKELQIDAVSRRIQTPAGVPSFPLNSITYLIGSANRGAGCTVHGGKQEAREATGRWGGPHKPGQQAWGRRSQATTFCKAFQSGFFRGLRLRRRSDAADLWQAGSGHSVETWKHTDVGHAGGVRPSLERQVWCQGG